MTTAKKQPKGKTNTRRREIIWRYTIVSAAILLFAGFITRSAVNTTVVYADEWNAKANRELSRVDTIKPKRGDILAADGSVLATNVNYYNIRLDLRASKLMEDSLRKYLPQLSELLARQGRYSADQWQDIITDALAVPKDKRTRSLLILEGLTWQESEDVKQYPYFACSSNANRTGYTRETRVKRCNPYGQMASRSIGRVSEQKDGKIRGYSGLEYALDSLLYGRPGIARKVPLTHRIENWTDKPAQPGYTLRTTIDIAMQDIVETELNAMLDSTRAEWGTCVLMEVATGDIKAISNLERDTTGRYIEAMNYALLGFEPGSVMKTMSMVVALEDGFVTDIEQVYPIGGSYVFGGGSPIRDSHSPATLPVSRFLEYSSNIGMTKLVAPHFRDDPNKFRERLAQLGFLDPFNTGIAGERIPYFPQLDIKDGGLVSLGRQTYGYTSLIPPLYTCAFYNAVAGDGKFVRPRIVSRITTERGDSILPVTYVRKQMCSPHNAAIVRRMLRRVITGKGGTARMLENDLVHIAGKTGTSKVANEVRRDKDGKVIPGTPKGYIDGQYRLTFCGFFPYEKPKYTCVVMISRPAPQFRSAGNTSGMVLRNIALKMYSRGMLDNTPRYDNEARRTGSLPMIQATDPGATASLKSMLGVHAVERIVAPRTGGAGLPDVRGLGVRQAISALERAGYAVSVRGTGYVTAQNPPAGSQCPKGSRITLSLRQTI